MAGYLISALAAAGLATAGVATAAGLRSADALPVIMLADGAAAAGKCSVKVVRTGEAGTTSIVRDELPDGSCTCIVTTGAASANGAAETVVSDLLRDRECSGAPSAEAAANSAGGETAGAAAGAAGPGAILPVLLGAGGAGGLGAALGNASNG